MGLSVANQVDTRSYFSLSTINKVRMQELGLKMTAKDLRERAKKSNPYMILSTGDIYGHQKNTNIYRYKDFLPVPEGDKAM